LVGAIVGNSSVSTFGVAVGGGVSFGAFDGASVSSAGVGALVGTIEGATVVGGGVTGTGAGVGGTANGGRHSGAVLGHMNT